MALLSSALQSTNGGLGATAEFFDLYAHALGEGDEEVGEGSVIIRIMGDVVSVLVTAAGEQNGQVTPAMRGGVTEIGTEQNGSVVEQMAALFLDVFHLL